MVILSVVVTDSNWRESAREFLTPKLLVSHPHFPPRQGGTALPRAPKSGPPETVRMRGMNQNFPPNPNQPYPPQQQGYPPRVAPQGSPYPVLVSTMNDLPGYTAETVYGEVFGLTVRSRDFGSKSHLCFPVVADTA